MPSNSGINKLSAYIHHLEHAAQLLTTLPNKFYRDKDMNLTFNEHIEKLKALADEMSEIYNLLPEELKTR